ncbi:hypothetical protein GCM10009718_29900 [Isoptericola halotolerans]|uniref:Uncharacterized protein n=1 Tax=Isoptericola halotolerans TaxID=300560 RepID=A0ABX2A4G3_9MICO|nr:hypothetical protein [Isoptericola halotolerans]NOV97669.1 hypothetical protein [Isoptericola halotolerans]
MPTYAVDGKRQDMVATGVVEPEMEWFKNAEGQWRSGDVQARQEGTGLPLWGVEVAYASEEWGRVETVTAMVVVGSATQPAPSKFAPVTFGDLVVSVRVDRNKKLRESWVAGSVDLPAGKAPRSAGASDA